MLTKSNPDEIQSYLTDASNFGGGRAECVYFPSTAEEAAEVLAEASRMRTPVTVSGAGTGVTGGRVPFGGIVLATDRLSRMIGIAKEESGAWAAAEAGVVLGDFQTAVAAQGLLYPPDPTEWSCYLGATVATNASGARTFKYGATRRYVRRLQIALASGDLIQLRRGEIFADQDGRLQIPIDAVRSIEAQLPDLHMPQTRKHAAGYFIAPGMDAIDLFTGSEGTLGVITEVEVDLLPQPENVLAGVVFFDREEDLLAAVREARAASLQTRKLSGQGIDARAIEYFDARSLDFLRSNNPRIPEQVAGAIFFEQEITEQTEDALLALWLELLERAHARLDESWFATGDRDRQTIREFRHQLPVLVNEWIARHGQRKVSTDMAVPDDEFAAMLRFYQQTLEASRLQYVIFGHIGDNHVHVNILPRDDDEAQKARGIYGDFVRRAVAVGGTVSAEHGIGKLKREYLRVLYGDEALAGMARLKLAFDPAGILGRGNLFSEDLLST